MVLFVHVVHANLVVHELSWTHANLVFRELSWTHVNLVVHEVLVDSC